MGKKWHWGGGGAGGGRDETKTQCGDMGWGVKTWHWRGEETKTGTSSWQWESKTKGYNSRLGWDLRLYVHLDALRNFDKPIKPNITSKCLYDDISQMYVP